MVLLKPNFLGPTEKDAWIGMYKLFRLGTLALFGDAKNEGDQHDGMSEFFDEFGWPCLECIEQASVGINQWISTVTTARIHDSHTKRNEICEAKTKLGGIYASFTEAIAADLQSFLGRLGQLHTKMQQSKLGRPLLAVPSMNVAGIKEHLQQETPYYQATWWFWVAHDAGNYSGMLELFPGLSLRPETNQWLARDMDKIALYSGDPPLKHREFTALLLQEESYIRVDYPELFASQLDCGNSAQGSETTFDDLPGNKPERGGRPPSEKKRQRLEAILAVHLANPGIKPGDMADALKSDFPNINPRQVSDDLYRLRKDGKLQETS